MAKADPSKKTTGRQPAQPISAPSAARSDKSKLLAGTPFQLLLLALVGLAAYANTFHVPFVFDDNSSIVNNPVIRNLAEFLSGAGFAYNPRRFIGHLSFAVNYQFGGLDVTGYHLVNLTVHILTAWLVYCLALLTLKTPMFKVSGFMFKVGEPETLNLKPETLNFIPLLAALLFVAHPVQTQAVTYIVQRFASLATFFYLAALVCYVKARMFQVSGFMSQVEKPETLNLKPETLIFFTLSLLAALLAMTTKEIAATLPIVVLLYELSFFGMNGRKQLLFLIPLLLTILVIPLGMLHTGKPLGELLSDVSELTKESQIISRGDYLLTQFAVIVTYLRLLLLPVGQNLDYDYPVYHSLFAPRVLASFLLLCAIMGGALWLYYRSSFTFQVARFKLENLKPETSNLKLPLGPLRLIAFGILWFFITLAVESSVIPITDVIFEHRLYLPSVGAFIALAALAAIVFRRTSVRAVMAWSAVIVVILTAATINRNRAWQDNLTLWSDAVAKSPNKSRPHYNLGRTLSAGGQLDQAIAEYQTALQLLPDSPEILTNLGTVYCKKEWMDRGIEEFRKALHINPAYGMAHFNLGAAYLVKGWTDQAISELLTALQTDQANGNIHFNLGLAYEQKGWRDKALDQYRLLLQLQPGDGRALKHIAALTEHNDKGNHKLP